MFVLFSMLLLALGASARPGYPWDAPAPWLGSPAPAPWLGSPEPWLGSPAIVKTAIPAPILAPAPVYHEPVYAHAPIIKAAPVIAAPIVKAIAPATSYATVTQVHVTHPQIIKVAQPIIKTVVAQPVLKAYAPAPWEHGYYH